MSKNVVNDFYIKIYWKYGNYMKIYWNFMPTFIFTSIRAISADIELIIIKNLTLFY